MVSDDIIRKCQAALASFARCTSSDGKIKHCFINYDQRTNNFSLIGYREFVHNIVMAIDKDHAKLIELGKEFGCINEREQR